MEFYKNPLPPPGVRAPGQLRARVHLLGGAAAVGGGPAARGALPLLQRHRAEPDHLLHHLRGDLRQVDRRRLHASALRPLLLLRELFQTLLV